MARRARNRPLWIALGLLAIGALVSAVRYWPQRDPIISGIAFTLAAVLTLFALADLVLDALGIDAEELTDEQRSRRASLRAFLVPAGLLAGLLFGHFFWD